MERLTETQKQNRLRILDISYRHKLSHLGSNLTAVDIIEHIYSVKSPTDRFVLSSGHAGLALYTVLERHGLGDAEDLFNKHGVHPNKDTDIDCSTGSLGQGLPIAVGMAMACRERNVYALISDGESREGSIFEALRIAGEFRLDNLKVHCNANGWSAYDKVSVDHLEQQFRAFRHPVRVWRTDNRPLTFLDGLQAHYRVMSDQDYQQAKEVLK